ncbi:MAG: endonuclease domain-containing protein, partial [Armatimonadetes bacterium]|nr:endonuclease domain-containing protein [Armatimonadota bacterium]
VRRQFPVGRAILDFCIPEYCLGIELDGDIHLSQQEYDASRTEYLQARGYRIIRFANETIESDLPSVLAEIEKALNDLKNERNTPSD